MEKILVTTDFSANSKAGLRFAIQLASQHKYNLVFFHSYHIMKPTSWNDKVFAAFEKSEITKIKKKLEHFVDSVYKQMGVTPANMSCVVKSSFLIDSNIMDYAAKNEFNFICISRRGGGKHRKIFGTNTSNLINQSDVPIIAIPNNYRKTKITNILYTSDLANLENEVKRVVDFAKPLDAKIDLLHFKVPRDTSEDPEVIEKSIKKFTDYDISMHLENVDFAKTLIDNLEKVIQKSKPSMLIMFTQQNRSFFKRLFLSSISAEYSFQAKVPLLVFKKL